jgi:hypothetical protein
MWTRQEKVHENVNMHFYNSFEMSVYQDASPTSNQYYRAMRRTTLDILTIYCTFHEKNIKYSKLTHCDGNLCQYDSSSNRRFDGKTFCGRA